MLQPRRLLAVTSVALLAGLVAISSLIRLGPSVDSSLPTSLTPLATSAPADEVLAEPAIGPPGQERTTASKDPASARRPLDDKASLAPSAPLQLIVRGRVRVPIADPATDPGKATVSIERSDDSTIADINVPLRTGLAEDGSYEVDATPLVLRQGRAYFPNHLIVTAEHPACIVAKTWVRLGAPRSHRTYSDEVFVALGLADTGGTRVVDLDFELRLRATILGRVAVAEGDALPRTRLAIATLGEGGPNHDWEQTCWADQDGSFELAVASGSPYALVAVAEGFRPATAALEMTLPGQKWVELTLERGEALEGKLRLGSEPAPAGIGVVVSLADSSLGSHGLESVPGQLQWADGWFRCQSRLLRTTKGGQFVMSGLEPRMYSLKVLALGMPGVQALTLDAGQVQAPDRSLSIGPLLSQVGITIQSASPVGIACRLRPTGAGDETVLGPFVAHAHGQVWLWLSPDSEYEVEVGHDIVGRVQSGAAGSSSSWTFSD